VLSDWNYPDGSPEHTRARKNGIGITAVAICFAALIIILYGYREAVGQSLINLGQKISSSSETSQSQQPRESQAEPTKRPIETKATTAQVPTAGVKKEDAGKSPEPVIDTHNNPANAAPAMKPDNAFRDARPTTTPEQTSVIDSRIHDPAEQARSLWSAVAQGNTSAEVALARLYLIGGGVPKSCDQARVLLQAAARKGNGEALDKLSQLDRQGCP
jgi:TPR repeat protein